MNKSMKWILDSMERHLSEQYCCMPSIKEVDDETVMVLKNCSRETCWHVLQYLFSIQIRHIIVGNEVGENKLPTGTLFIQFDTRQDDYNKYMVRIV